MPQSINREDQRAAACQPQVSIVVPCYNSERFLAATLDSILAQSHTSFEVLVVDDCSSDGSCAIAKNYARKDKRIKPVRLTNNSGSAVARNTAIKLALGRYIAFCDSDDIWLEDKLTRQLAMLASSDCAICHTAYHKMREDGTLAKRVVLPPAHLRYKQMLKSNYIGCSTAIYDTDRCGKVYIPEVALRHDYGDYGLWLKILRQGHCSAGVREPLVHYRIHSSSLSSNKAKASFYHWRVLRQVGQLSLPHSFWLFGHYALRGLYKKIK